MTVEVLQVLAHENCPKCGEHLGLSMVVSSDGSVAELKIEPRRDPVTRRWLPHALVIDSTGVYCSRCHDYRYWPVPDPDGAGAVIAFEAKLELEVKPPDLSGAEVVCGPKPST